MVRKARQQNKGTFQILAANFRSKFSVVGHFKILLFDALNSLTVQFNFQPRNSEMYSLMSSLVKRHGLHKIALTAP